jgi:hypothetical protein
MKQKGKSQSIFFAVMLMLFGAGSALGFQALTKDETTCEQILDTGRVLSGDDSEVQRMFRYTFTLATYKMLDQSTQEAILERARNVEARYSSEKAGLSVSNGQLAVANFAQLSPAFRSALLESFDAGLHRNKSTRAMSDLSFVHGFARDASIIARSKAKCLPPFAFELKKAK